MSVGVYIHVPFCNGKCKYCNFVSGVYSDEVKERYFSELRREISSFDFEEKTVDTVYFGGGTPSSVSAEHIATVLDLLKKCVKFADKTEITVECNPESFSEEFARAVSFAGVNRISFGLQSASDDILKKIGRLHTRADFLNAVGIAKKYFANISADLMLGLPDQNGEDVIRAIDVLTMNGVKHVSVYSLKVEDGTPLQKSGYEPDEDFEATLYDLAFETLKYRGYERYEVSNFAVSGFECRHNLKYWGREEYVGFGVSAHSFWDDTRLENTPLLDEYLSGKYRLRAVKVPPRSREASDETLMLALRTRYGLDLTKYRKTFGIDIVQSKANQLRLLKDFVQVRDDALVLTDKGYYVMNEIIVRLMD